MKYDTKKNEQSALILLPPDSEMDFKGIKALRKMQSISEANGNNNLSLDEINEEIRAVRLDGDNQ